MTFSQFAIYLQQIEQTPKRLEMTALLADLLSRLQPDEVGPVAYLLQGKLVPKYDPLEFQLSTKMLFRVLARYMSSRQVVATDLFGEAGEQAADLLQVEQLYKQLGDIGLAAETIVDDYGAKIAHEIAILDVYNKLFTIATDEGARSQDRKVESVVQLLQMVDPLSARYIARIIVGKLRLGFSDMTMIDALSWVVAGDKSLSEQIEAAYQKRADIGFIASVVLRDGIASLDRVHVCVGTPIIPALCQRLNSAAEIIEKMGEVYAEPKYDGTRVQIHFQRNVREGSENVEIRTFTRNLEESSHMFPELQELATVLSCDSCILDAEAVAYDPETGALRPFQDTITRKRKHGVADVAEALPLRFFIFDILLKDDQSYMQHPLSHRKQILSSLFVDSSTFVQAPYLITSDPQQLHAYHQQQLAEGLEGLVMKKVDGIYQSGRKAFSWVKIKEAEGNRGKLSDTLDCVVMGYFLATGARRDFIIGSLLVGVLADDGTIQTLSKVGSGLAEDLSKQLIEKTNLFVVSDKPAHYRVHKQLTPDVWLAPQVVIEVAADELTTSPIHTAGVALRFPRILRVRADKSWQQATTCQELSQISVGDGSSA